MIVLTRGMRPRFYTKIRPLALYGLSRFAGASRPNLWSICCWEALSGERLATQVASDEKPISKLVDSQPWSDFQSTCETWKLKALREAAKPPEQRQDFGGWTILNSPSQNSQFWCAFENIQDNTVAVVFPGGRGNLADAKVHPSSPVRRILDTTETNPAEYFSPFYQFVDGLKAAHPNKDFHIVGYSMGGFAALMTAHKFFEDDKFKTCTTLNPVMAFAADGVHPQFLSSAVSEKLIDNTQTWMLDKDPIAGLPSADWKCARPWGSSVILPAVHNYNILRNHSLCHFLTHLEE